MNKYELLRTQFSEPEYIVCESFEVYESILTFMINDIPIMALAEGAWFSVEQISEGDKVNDYST